MIAAFVRYKATVIILTFCIFVFGWRSYNSLPRESFPDVKIPVVLISTVYVGVSPADIESLVTIPIENEVAGVSDIRKLSSTSAEGASIISIEFEPDVVIEDALQRVRDRVNRAKPDLPEDAEEPEVREVSFSDFPIMIVTLAGPQDLEELKRIGEGLQDRFDRVEGVLDVKISGGLERQFRVQIDPNRLAHYGLSLDDVIGAIQNENTNIPGGDVRAGDATYLLRVPGEFEAASDLETVAIKRRGDRPVFISDVGRVIDGFADRASYARMNGETAISIAITKRTGANILSIAQEVKRIAAEESERFPEGVTYRVLADQSEQIEDMVSELENNILTALVLVVTVIFFFMGARNSLFVALSIPLSMLASFAILQAFGITLNMVVLFSLILALGMLVDNAIVIVENIYRHAEEGKPPTQAAIEGTREVAIAVAASTATTVCAFFPLVFWEGIMGEFMGYLPKTVIIVLLSSLVVAIAILPVMTAAGMKVSKKMVEEGPARDNSIMHAYKSVLEFSIAHRYISAGLGVGTLIFSFVAYFGLNHGTEFFPDVDPNRATVGVRAPDGTDVEATDRIVRRIEAVLAQMENVDVAVAETGVSGGGNPMEGAQAVPNQARLTVDFLPDRNSARPGEQTRVERTPLTIDRLRSAVQEIPGAEVTVEKEEMGPPVGAAIAVEVSGDDFHQVGALAASVRRGISGIPGVTDVSDDYRVGRPEMVLRINRGAAKRVGASTRTVASTVRTAVAGSKATTIRDGEDEYDVVVELDERYTNNLQDVLALRIPGREDNSPDTFSVPISAVASYELAGGSGSIRHIDQELVVTITGDVLDGFNENAVRAAVQDYIDGVETPPGYALRLGGADDEQRKAQEFLTNAFLLAVALIAIVLVTQFNSISTPLIIIFTVVLSLIGVLWGLILTGTPFGIIMTGLGVISLAGVVVNNAIVLLDYVEQLKDRGLDNHDALVEAGMTRFRPVMLTAITTVLGLVPMAIGLSVDFKRMQLIIGGSTAQWWGPMAVAVIFGLAFATVLTLVMVPTLYSIIEDVRSLPGRIKRRFSSGAAATAAMLLLALPGAAEAVTLDEAFAAAEDNNVDLAIAHERTVQAETLRGQAWSLISPKVSTAGSYTLNEYEIAFDFADSLPETLAEQFDTGGPQVIQAKEYFQASATVSQPLFSGSAFPLLKAAYRQVDAARSDEDRARVQIRAGVARAFYNVGLARKSLEMAEQSLAVANNQLELANRQVAAGIAPPRAKLQAQLAVRQADREVATAREQVVIAQEAFATATGLPPDTDVTLPESQAIPASLDEALQSAQESRADLEAARQRVHSARLQHTAKLMEWAPRLDGRFTYSWNENTGFSNDETIWMVVFEASWNLWDGGMRSAQAKEQASQVRVSQLVASQTVRQIEEDVRTAWQRYERAQESLSAVESEVALANENLRLVEAEFQAGSATWLEVEDARLSQFATTLGALREQVDRDLAAVELKVAMGDY